MSDYVVSDEFKHAVGRLEPVLTPYVTLERRTRMQNIVAARTRKVLCVFESTNHSHNISAVLRTMDALGFQDGFFVYTDIESTKFRVADSVERGSAEWLSVRRGTSVEKSASYLKAAGYNIALVSLPSFFRTGDSYEHRLPHYSADTFRSPEFSKHLSEKPLALVFGNEKMGVDDKWIPHADMYVSISMHGFVESLNVSVCAGVLLYELRTALAALSKNGFQMNFTETEKTLLLESWMARDVNAALKIVKRGSPDLLSYLEYLRHGKFYAPSL